MSKSLSYGEKKLPLFFFLPKTNIFCLCLFLRLCLSLLLSLFGKSKRNLSAVGGASHQGLSNQLLIAPWHVWLTASAHILQLQLFVLSLAATRLTKANHSVLVHWLIYATVSF